MKKAIIIGASSGIGYELAKVLSQQGYEVGLTGRRLQLLEKLQAELENTSYIRAFDVRENDAPTHLEQLIDEMGDLDLIVINSGTGFIDPGLPWENEKQTIETNVLGFNAMANVAFAHFRQKGSGHIVGISSIAAIRGGPAPSYNASKAYVSNYLQGLRLLSIKEKKQITVTDIQPGFVDTEMAKGVGLFWVAPPQKAAQQIYQAIAKRKKHAYITKRWRLIAWIVKLMPDYLYNRIT